MVYGGSGVTKQRGVKGRTNSTTKWRNEQMSLCPVVALHAGMSSMWAISLAPHSSTQHKVWRVEEEKLRTTWRVAVAI